MQRTYSAASIIYIKVDPQASTHPIEEISPARKEIIIDEKNVAVDCILLGRKMKAKLSEYVLSACIVQELSVEDVRRVAGTARCWNVLGLAFKLNEPYNLGDIRRMIETGLRDTLYGSNIR